MASIRGILNIQSLNELTSEKRLIRSDAADRAAPLGAAGCGWCAGRPTRDVTASEAAGAADAVARRDRKRR